MKATIGGITIEGTPQEIMEYQRIQAEKAAEKQKQPFSPTIDANPYNPRVANANTRATRCPSSPMPCNCTGACNRPIDLAELSKTFEQWDKEIGNIIKAMR